MHSNKYVIFNLRTPKRMPVPALTQSLAAGGARYEHPDSAQQHYKKNVKEDDTTKID